MTEDMSVRTPWHNAVLFEAATGKYVTNRKSALLLKTAGNRVALTVYFEARPWMLLKLQV